MAEATFGTSGGALNPEGSGAPAAPRAAAPVEGTPEAGAAGAETKTPEQLAAEEAATKASSEEKAKQEKADADKKAADEQAAQEAAKALLFSDIKELKLPDGPIDEETAQELAAFSTEKGLTKIEAQRVADMGLKFIGNYNKHLQEQAQAQVKVWWNEIYEDKDLGGAKVEETGRTADKFFEFAATVPKVDVERMRSVFRATGIANQPDFVRAMVAFGKHLQEDNTFIQDRSTAGAPKDAATILYGETGVKQK